MKSDFVLDLVCVGGGDGGGVTCRPIGDNGDDGDNCGPLGGSIGSVSCFSPLLVLKRYKGFGAGGRDGLFLLILFGMGGGTAE